MQSIVISIILVGYLPYYTNGADFVFSVPEKDRFQANDGRQNQRWKSQENNAPKSVPVKLSVDLMQPTYVLSDKYLSYGMDSNLIRNRWQSFDFRYFFSF